MFDVDKFKEINDNYGHLVGDLVLKKITAAVNEVIRDFDLFARYGGDEFAVGLPSTDITAANKVALRILDKIAEIKVVKGVNLEVSCSIGIATLAKEKSIEDLIDKADKALYTCKSDGGNCVIHFKSEFA